MRPPPFSSFSLRVLCSSLFIVGVLLLALTFAPALAQDAPTNLRVANYASDSDPVEVWLNGAFSGIQVLKYGETSGWSQLAPGAYNVAFVPSGSPLEAAYVRFDVTLNPGAFNTLTLNGLVREGRAFANLVPENYTTGLAPDHGRITVVNTAIGGDGVDFVTGDGRVLITGIRFGRSASVDLPGSVYTFRVVPAGGSPTGPGLNARLRIMPNAYYLLTTVRTAQGAGLTLAGVAQEPMTGLIAAAQASAGANPPPEPVAIGSSASPQRSASSTGQDPGLSIRRDPIREAAELSFASEGGATLMDLISYDSRLGRFRRILEYLEIDAALRNRGPFTVFAPTDNAFDRLERGIVSNDQQIETMIRYHIVTDIVRPIDIFDDMTLITTFTQETVRLDEEEDGRFRVNGSRVLYPYAEASNGMLYIIPDVLVPQVLLVTPTPAPDATADATAAADDAATDASALVNPPDAPPAATPAASAPDAPTDSTTGTVIGSPDADADVNAVPDPALAPVAPAGSLSDGAGEQGSLFAPVAPGG